MIQLSRYMVEIRFNRYGLALDWTGLDWTGLDWIGLDWIGLERI